MLVVTFACGKGGVGKTAAALSVAHGFAQRGRRVMLVDLDPLGYATSGLGLERAPGVYDMLVRRAPKQEVLVEARENLWLVPGNSESKLVETVMSARRETPEMGVDIMRQYAGDCDVIIMDTPPSGMMQEIGLAGAEVTVVPMTTDFNGVEGLTILLGLLDSMKLTGPLIFLPSIYNARLPLSVEFLDKLRGFAEERGAYFNEPVPLREEFRHMVVAGHTIWEHDVKGHRRRAVADLQGVFDRLMDYLEKEEEHVAA